MHFPKLQSSADKHLMSDERRRGGRIGRAPAKCSLGKVIDISARGMSVRAHGVGPRRDQMIRFTLACSSGVFQLVGQVTWTRRHGLVSYEMGIHFLELTPEAEVGLNAIVRDALGQMTVDGWDKKPKKA